MDFGSTRMAVLEPSCQCEREYGGRAGAEVVV
jgi:hypothetical protein